MDEYTHVYVDQPNDLGEGEYAVFGEERRLICCCHACEHLQRIEDHPDLKGEVCMICRPAWRCSFEGTIQLEDWAPLPTLEYTGPYTREGNLRVRGLPCDYEAQKEGSHPFFWTVTFRCDAGYNRFTLEDRAKEIDPLRDRLASRLQTLICDYDYVVDLKAFQPGWTPPDNLQEKLARWVTPQQARHIAPVIKDFDDLSEAEQLQELPGADTKFQFNAHRIHLRVLQHLPEDAKVEAP